jgi:hypothetical protein
MFQIRGVRDFCDQNVHGVHCGNKNLSQPALPARQAKQMEYFCDYSAISRILAICP